MTGGREPIVFDPAEFEAMWRAGETCTVIAARFGASRGWVSLAAGRLGLPRRMTPQGTLPARAIVEAYVAGATLDQLRTQLLPKFPTVSRTLLRSTIQAHGVAMRQVGSHDPILVRDVVRLARAGLTYAAIAKRLGCSESGVGKVARKVLGGRGHGRRREEFSHARMWSMLREGRTVRECANELGCTPQAIRWHINRKKAAAALEASA